MQQLPQYPSSSNQEHGPTSSIAAPKPTDFGYHPPVGTPGYSSHAEGSPVMGHPVPLSMQHGPTVVDVDNTIYYPPATVIAPAMNPNGYCVVYVRDSHNECPVQLILFITGLLCTPIICCVGACLPLCDRRFKQGGEQCGWIANVVGSIVTSIITIVIIFVAAFGKRLGNVCFDDDNYYTCD